MAKAGPNPAARMDGLILAVLEENPLHGYGIAREIEKRSKDVLRMGEGSLYPALRTLEQDGFIAGEWDTTGPGAARKVYRLSDDGVDELRKLRANWYEYARSVDSVYKAGRKQAQAQEFGK